MNMQLLFLSGGSMVQYDVERLKVYCEINQIAVILYVIVKVLS